MRGGLSPLCGGFWGTSPKIFLNFERFYVRFNGVFMRLGPDFSRFGHDLLLERYFLSHEKPNTGQNCFQTVTIFFFIMFF